MKKYIVFLIGLLLLLALLATWNVGPIGAQGIETPSPSPTPTLVATDEPSGNELCSRGGEYYNQPLCEDWLNSIGIQDADECFDKKSPGTCCGAWPEDNRCVAVTSTPTPSPTNTPPPSPSPSPSPTPSPSATSTMTPTMTVTPTFTVTASPSPTGTWEPTPTDEPTDEPKTPPPTAEITATPTAVPVADFIAPRSGGNDRVDLTLAIFFIALVVGGSTLLITWRRKK